MVWPSLAAQDLIKNAPALRERLVPQLAGAQGIWRQIYENRRRQRDKASKKQAEAARDLAAIVFVENAAEGLHWYREATQLDPDNREGWLGLGEAAQATGTMEEAKDAYRRSITLARRADDERGVAVGRWARRRAGGGGESARGAADL